MRIRMKDGYVQIIEAGPAQAAALKSWGSLIKWRKKMHQWGGAGWEGPVCAELLNKLAGTVPLTGSLEAERRRLNAIQEAVDAERVRPAEGLRPFVKYPVKRSLYAHQIRAANMCLLTFGLIDPANWCGKKMGWRG